jgi:microcystin-dependent protein
MSEPYVGEIRMFGGNFAPSGWAMCAGQLLAISENDTLFTLIGTTYGGDGQSTFGLPNLQGRVPIHQGQGFTIGQLGGTESVTLTTSQLPVHSHPMLATNDQGSQTSPGNAFAGSLPSQGQAFPYGTDEPFDSLDGSSIGSVGGSQPHENLQPYLTVSFIISLFGIFPTQN